MFDDALKKYNPSIVYDIGAHTGQFTKKCQKILPNSIFHLFEASPNKNGKGNWHKVVLSHTDDAEVTFYYDGGTGDTYYKETDQFLKTKYKTTTLKTKRLDSYVKENNLPLPDFIKIDVQGAELDILRGCDEIMNYCKLVHCEIPAEGIEFNKGAPTQEEYLDFFDSFGFTHKLNVRDHKRNGKLIIQHDYIFSKEEL